ncbi:cytochrome b reductase 1-like [Denticeps clupeoides]|uniref:Plasma membrane ascorbate-dependent reductase CYBRD1 n=1 Tax=Denticeps clupeoides TaxID=299321 RepID=A0A8C3ZF45_9TELE|nr:cytochrome b reductase 1-like [Denticeps clupeoides]XP_028847291.1 cytochrome b reductase 1-like [Denticeps clupeoides]
MQRVRQLLVSLAAAVAVGSAAVGFVLRWVLHYKEGLGWDGGPAEFNWHPVLVVIGLVFLQGVAITVYRIPWTWTCSKLRMKFIHAGLNVLAFALTVTSLVAVFDFHNAQRIPNMYSLHSWVGLAAVLLYALQLVLGLVVYLVPITPGNLRAAFMPVHIYSGIFIFATVIATTLMGITEKLIFGLRDPPYRDSPPEAVLVNVLGLLVIVFAGLVVWIVTRPSWKRPGENVPQTLSSGDNSNTATNMSLRDRGGKTEPK